MKLSICVVNYHSEKTLRDFFESLTLFRPQCLFEVIVVNNGGDKEALKKLRKEFGNWLSILSPPKNIGFGAAQNRAVHKARGEYIFLCNPDLEVDEGGFAKLLEFAEDLGEFGIIGPRLMYANGEIQASCRRFPRFFDLIGKRLGFLPFFRQRLQRYLMGEKALEKPTKVEWLVGAAMLMKRDVFLQLKGFDERFFLFFEDTDLCRRVRQADYDVWYYPDSVFLHRQERLSESRWPGFWVFKKTFWIHFMSSLKYFWKWRGRVERENIRVPHSEQGGSGK